MEKKQYKILPIFIFLIFLIIASFFLKDKQNNEFSQETKSSRLKEQEFIVIGDTGTGSDAQFEVAESIENYCATKNCKAVFIPGDVIYDEGVTSVNDPQFNSKFEEPYKDIRLPFFIMFGNHDYLGCRECYIDYDESSDKWEMPSPYYIEKFDSISFYALNTEEFSNEQHDWLVNEINKDDAEWKVVLGHRPLKTFEETRTDDVWSGEYILKHAVCDSADLYISGHAHILEDPGNIEDCKVRQLISGSGGSYPRKVKKPHAGSFYLEDNGFLVIKVDSNSLIYEFYDKKGNSLYQNSL